MSKLIDRPLTAEEYEELARAYYKTLPLEHFMESIPQATQRKIALESLDLVHARRPEVQIYSELLIQYRVQGAIRRVVPDNMVRLCDQPPVTSGSFNLELEPAGPLWVLEWVSSSSEGKDYGEAFEKYERDLRVPYCLLYYPEQADFRLYRHNGRRYALVSANEQGRLPLPELDLELGLIGEWVRFWYRGELLDLPADLQKRIDELEERISTAEKQAKTEKRRAERERKRAEQANQLAEQERQARLAAEQELARLRALLEQRQNEQTDG